MPHGSWTDEKVARLKALWLTGISCSRMGAELGCTRNAIIGKVHRLKLPLRGQSYGPWSSKPGFRRPVETKKPKHKKPTALRVTRAPEKITRVKEPYIEPTENQPIPLAQRKTIQNITDNHCKWGVGDPQAADFHFCGGKAVPGLPYCKHHAKRAYNDVATRESKKKQANKPTVTAKKERVPEYVGGLPII